MLLPAQVRPGWAADDGDAAEGGGDKAGDHADQGDAVGVDDGGPDHLVAPDHEHAERIAVDAAVERAGHRNDGHTIRGGEGLTECAGGSPGDQIAYCHLSIMA